MVHVSSQLKKQVDDRIAKDLDTIHARYGVMLPKPTVSYDLCGTTAGQAFIHKNYIKINAVLLVENVDEMLNRTVPHELAHLATQSIYPEAHRRGFASKRRPHGAEWQSIMRVLGADASRCHSYNTSNSAVKRSNRAYFEVKCVECQHIYKLGPVRAQRFQTNSSAIWCGCVKKRGHKGKLVAVNPLPVVSGNVIMGGKVVGTLKNVTFTTNESKLNICKRLYNHHTGTLSRQGILRLFMSKAGCTTAGAATYYNKCRKG